MDFATFSAARNQALAANPDWVDCGETRIEPHLSRLYPNGWEHTAPAKGHRCHLAQMWLERYAGLSSGNPHVWVCKGVRHALGLMFAQYAKQQLRVAMPSDVYPVYELLAQRAGCVQVVYETWPTIEALPQADVLLLTLPLKPRGSVLSEQELTRVLDWLAKDSRRRLVLDAVYDLSRGLSGQTRMLLERGQTVVLHSLSKAWALPMAAGFVVGPEQDRELWRPVFEAEPVGEVERARMALAEVALRHHADMPERLTELLNLKEDVLRRICAQRGVSLHASGAARLPRYLFTVDSSAEALEQFGILAIPFSVFGSERKDVAVLSSLSLSAGRCRG